MPPSPRVLWTAPLGELASLLTDEGSRGKTARWEWKGTCVGVLRSLIDKRHWAVARAERLGRELGRVDLDG